MSPKGLGPRAHEGVAPCESHPLSPSHWAHRGAEAAAAHGAPELPKGLLGSARGVEALSQQHDAVEEEKRGQSIDDILEILDAEEETIGKEQQTPGLQRTYIF